MIFLMSLMSFAFVFFCIQILQRLNWEREWSFRGIRLYNSLLLLLSKKWFEINLVTFPRNLPAFYEITQEYLFTDFTTIKQSENITLLNWFFSSTIYGFKWISKNIRFYDHFEWSHCNIFIIFSFIGQFSEELRI